MACCNEFVYGGCFDYCQDIDTGIVVEQSGIHNIIVYVVNSTYQTIAVEVFEEDTFIIPAGLLNEASPHQIHIVQPDGTLYDFGDGITCLHIRTYIAIDGGSYRICTPEYNPGVPNPLCDADC